MAKSGEPQLKSAQASLIAKVAVETDYETYVGFGKDSLKTAAWMLSVIANSSQIFEQEVNVKLEVSYLKIWTTPEDPYVQQGYNLFNDFYEYIKVNYKDVKRDVALLIIRDGGRLSGGTATMQLGDPENSFLVAGEFAVTHELGHVFGSPHTHDCRWPAGSNGTLAPIDQCATLEGNCGIAEIIQQEGTIMSYCGTSKPVFGPFVQHLIRARAEQILGKSSLDTHEVKGKVTSNGIGLSGVEIAFNTWFSGEYFNTITDANGNYLINLPDNLYNYTASKGNYYITPLGPQNIDKNWGSLYVSEVNVSGIDFDALEVKSDLFEPDDSPALANEIKPDGTVQARSIHMPWNFDYFKFQAEVGRTYTVVINSKIFTPPGFEIIDTDGGNLLAYSSLINTNAQTLIWKAEKDGTYYIKVTGNLSNYDISVHNIFSAINTGMQACFSKNSEWGDFDSDGDFDPLIADYIASPYRYYLYTKDNFSFTQKEKNIENPIYGGRSTLKWADLDNDGDLDVVVGNMYGINAYSNDPGGFSIRRPLSEYAGRPISYIDPGDYDNDGDVDILFPSVEDKKIHILKNENGIFTNISTGMPGFHSGKTTWMDFDNDGDLDIAIAGSTDGGSFGEALVKIYRNENDQFYDNGPVLDQITGEPSFAFGDFDLDGDPDMALAGSLDGKQVLKIYRNNNGIFENTNTSLSGVLHASLNWGDFDNDGDPDLIMSGMPKVGGPNQQTSLLENKKGIFEESRISPSLLQIVGTSNWCDVDGDNALDLFLIGETWNGNQSVLLKNENRIKNSPPNPPANIKVQASESKTIFSWSPATDNKTPAIGLTYNLRIGTAPGKANILSPNSNIKTGKRLVVNTGNAGYRLNKTINNLKGGTYYWSVQAIDNSYVGSEWAPEQTFTIKSNIAPTANAGADQTVDESATVTLDGSQSSDPDLDNLTYKWTTSAGITLSSVSVQKPSFIAPEVKKDSILTFTLVVNDGIVDSSPASVKITVRNVIKVGVSDISVDEFKVYPNPTTGEVYFDFGEPVSTLVVITVYNTEGSVVKTMFAEAHNKLKIDLAQMISGWYFIKVESETNSYLSKVLLQK
jgi:hypothetical protein